MLARRLRMTIGHSAMATVSAGQEQRVQVAGEAWP